MKDPSGRGAAFGFGDGPRLRGGSDEELAAGGSDTAEGLPVDRSRGATARDLAAIFGFVEIGLLDADILPVDIEFFGNEHGHGSLDALAGFGIFGGDGENVVGGDVDEGGGDEILVGGWGLGLSELERIEVEGEKDAAGGGGGDFQEAAAIEESGD